MCALNLTVLLDTNTECDNLCPDAKELMKPTALNKRTNLKDLVPWAFLLIAGLMCCDKTPASTTQASKKTSMQQQEGKTNDTFQMVLAYIMLSQPVFITLENVKEMLCMDLDVSTMSDAM